MPPLIILKITIILHLTNQLYHDNLNLFKGHIQEFLLDENTSNRIRPLVQAQQSNGQSLRIKTIRLMAKGMSFSVQLPKYTCQKRSNFRFTTSQKVMGAAKATSLAKSIKAVNVSNKPG